MLSSYAEFHLYAYAYVAIVGMVGYSLGTLTNRLLSVFFPPLNDNVPLFPVPPQQQLHPPTWEHVGWYRASDKQYVPLFHLPTTNKWIYPLRDGFVHPKEAAVQRRGIPLLEPGT